MRRRYKILLYIMIFITTFADLNSLFKVGAAIGETGMEYIYARISMAKSFGGWTAYIIGIAQFILVMQETRRIAMWGVFSSRNSMYKMMFGIIVKIYMADIILKNLSLVWVAWKWHYIYTAQMAGIFGMYNMTVFHDFAVMTAISLAVCLFFKYKEIV